MTNGARNPAGWVMTIVVSMVPLADAADPPVLRSIERGLAYLAATQARDGRWEANSGMYPAAMTALAGMAFLLDGNTPLQGRYAKNVQAAVGYLLDQVQSTGLIGDPVRDSRYMYGHGFAMLFLSQALGEEEDSERRRRLVDVLTNAVTFSAQAQTVAGGWGYLSATEGRGFDEGSVTITQMQGLRACRNSGIAVPKEVIDKGVRYIEQCTEPDGGVRYSLNTRGGSRPPISAAAIACLYSAGDYRHPNVGKMIAYVEKSLAAAGRTRGFGHWHYAQYYYAQVAYRQGDTAWRKYRDEIFAILLDQQATDGSWNEGYIGPVYTTALNLAILQLDNQYLPIYQR